ncbi:MAG: DUF2442 domain-containing protein [Clostridiales bacterium]|nr:DUF2442 domain-containing protein [Clostridiales bacterium]
MFHRVSSVQTRPDYILDVCFQDGTRRYYDVSQLFSRWEVFKTLNQVQGLFEQVKVDASGYGVSWNDDLDLSCNELWENGIQTGEMGGELGV